MPSGRVRPAASLIPWVIVCVTICARKRSLPSDVTVELCVALPSAYVASAVPNWTGADPMALPAWETDPRGAELEKVLVTRPSNW